MLCDYAFLLISGVGYGAAAVCPQQLTMIVSCAGRGVSFANFRQFNSGDSGGCVNARAQRGTGCSEEEEEAPVPLVAGGCCCGLSSGCMQRRRSWISCPGRSKLLPRNLVNLISRK